jgi:hypothetical protein
LAFGFRLRAAGIVPSVNSVGTCFDMAVDESFSASLIVELVDRCD